MTECTDTSLGTYWQGSSTDGDPNYTIQAPLYELRWRSFDRTESASSADTTTTKAQPTSNANKGTSEGRGAHGLSTGSIIATAVIIPAAVIMLGILLFYCRRRMKRSRQTAQATFVSGKGADGPELNRNGEGEGLILGGTLNELPVSHEEQLKKVAEVEAKPLYEVEGMPAAYEKE